MAKTCKDNKNGKNNHFHCTAIEKRKKTRQQKKEKKKKATKEKKNKNDKDRLEHIKSMHQKIKDAAPPPSFKKQQEKVSKDADNELKNSRKKLMEHMKNGTLNRSEKRKAMLRMLAKNISKKAEAAEDRILLKTDKLVDILMAWIHVQLHSTGLPMIMGIEFLTLAISLAVDLIPIPGIGLLSEALEVASDGVVSGITAEGPGGLFGIIDKKFIPLLGKFAKMFQDIAGSFTCCGKKDDKTHGAEKLPGEIKKFITLIDELKKNEDVKKNTDLITALEDAEKKAKEALKEMKTKATKATGATGAAGAAEGGFKRRTKRRTKRRRKGVKKRKRGRTRRR